MPFDRMQVSAMQSIIQPEAQRKRLGDDNEYDHFAPATAFRHRYPPELYNTFPATGLNNNYQEQELMAQSWIPEPIFDLFWNDIRDSQAIWQHTSPSSQTNFSSHYGPNLRHATDIQDPPSPRSQFYAYGTALISTCSSTYQPCVQTRAQPVEGYGNEYLSQTPQTGSARSSSSQHDTYSNLINNIAPSNYSDDNSISTFVHDPNQDMSITAWIPFIQESPQQLPVSTPHSTNSEKVATPPVGLSLIWSTSELKPDSPTKKRKASLASTERKHTLLRSSTEEAPSDCHLEECVGVFENAPGALATVKKRKKLEAPVRKAARDVRKAGACHQCRFRKRTCSTGTPCGSCMKNGKGLHEIKCQRESPFIGRPVHEYFVYSSTKRVVTFNIRIVPEALSDNEDHFILIDGVDRLSHPIKLRAQKRLLSTFNSAERALIKRTQDKKEIGRLNDDDQAHVMILEEDENLGTRVEQWAVEYASKFVHAAGTKFRSTTIAVILGTAYVKKGLPESSLVAAMLRVASIAFVLRAGVKCTSSTPHPHSETNSRFRTTEATIDTILYQRLQIAVKDLFQMLQSIVFRKAGFLTREQVYPVALVFWQLLRISCLGASHLSNIVQRFNSTARTQSDYQYISLKLILSTHLALFRSSNPLLLDFSNKANHDLVGGDEEIIELAGKMQDVVLNFREKGFPELKGSLAYRKSYFDLFRRVYDGL